MPIAYVSGLTVTPAAAVRKERLLPVPGEVLVTRGQQVEADTPIARALRPGDLVSVKVTDRLGIDPDDLPGVMLKQPGEAVEAGEVIAETRALFGLFHNTCPSPVAGVIEHLSPLSGHVAIREPALPLEVAAHIGGQVERVIERQGAVVWSRAALVQGIFGVGGERRGILRVAAQGPAAPLEVAPLGDQARGAVLLGGANADGKALAAAAAAGAAAVVVGSVEDTDLRDFVGYDIGVAVTGQEQVPLTLIITEGFGRVEMAPRTFEVLAALAGRRASVDGATQIRAGVIRPEVIVPLGGAEPAPSPDPDHLRIPSPPGGADLQSASATESQLAPGARVRLIREPYFGQMATVTGLPAEPQAIETEARVRVAEVELADGRRALVPRANVEMVHG